MVAVGGRGDHHYPDVGLPRLGGLEEDFSGLGEWEVGMDLPVDRDTGRPVDARVYLTHDRYRSANASVEMTIEGWQDDGTVWIMGHL
ncbi:MAG: hypothetical protein ACLFPN_02780 [Methanomassiliicoccales archaeon]